MGLVRARVRGRGRGRLRRLEGRFRVRVRVLRIRTRARVLRRGLLGAQPRHVRYERVHEVVDDVAVREVARVEDAHCAPLRACPPPVGQVPEAGYIVRWTEI